MAAGEAVAVGDLDLSRDNGGGTVPVQRAKFGDMPGLVSKIRDEFFGRSFEVLSRRLLGMVEAYAGDASGKPNWRVAGHIGFYVSGGSGIDGAMSLEMRSFFQRTVRERNELEVAQRRGGLSPRQSEASGLTAVSHASARTWQSMGPHAHGTGMPDRGLHDAKRHEFNEGLGRMFGSSSAAAEGARDDADENSLGWSSSEADVGGGKYGGKGPGKSRARVSPYPARKK